MVGITSKFKGQTTLSAKVIRADGTIEDLGIIASTKPLSIFQKIKKMLNKIIKK